MTRGGFVPHNLPSDAYLHKISHENALEPGACVPAVNGLLTPGLFVQFDGDPCWRWRERHISGRRLSLQAHRDDHPAFISQ
jgi:hypothetical protein